MTRFGRNHVDRQAAIGKLLSTKQRPTEHVTDFITRVEEKCYKAKALCLMDKIILKRGRPELLEPMLINSMFPKNAQEVTTAARIAQSTMDQCSRATEEVHRKSTQTEIEPLHANEQLSQISTHSENKVLQTERLESESKGRCDQYNSSNIQPAFHVKHKRNSNFKNSNFGQIQGNAADVATLSGIKRKKFKKDSKKNHIQFVKQFFKNNKSNFQNQITRTENDIFGNFRPDLAPAISDSYSDNNCKIKIRIGDSILPALVDSGATLSVSRQDIFIKTGLKNKFNIETPDFPIIRGVNGNMIKVFGKVTLPLQIGRLELHQDFHILDEIQIPVILGRDFLKVQKATLDFSNQKLTLQGGMTEVSLNDAFESEENSIKLANNVKIPARTIAVVKVSIKNRPSDANLVGIIEPSSLLIGKWNIMGARCLVKPNSNSCYYQLLNPTNSDINLRKNCTVGNFSQVQSDKIFGEVNDKHATISNIDININSKQNSECIKIAKELDIDLSESDLTDAQKDALLTVIGHNRDAFAKDMSELGSCDIYKHKINTGDSKPIRQHRYRTTPKVQEEMSRQIDELERLNIIEKSTTPWQSPVVMVAKKTNPGDPPQLRFAIDFRKLNAVTEDNIYWPLPRLEEVLDTLGESRSQIFSVLDMRQGFFQLELDDETKHKTGFVTHKGVYAFNRLPYGLANSPGTFSIVMNEVLRDLNWKYSLCYVDDILLFSRSFPEHLGHLNAVFQKLREVNLKLKPSKCQFACKQVEYLGHVISKDGIAVDTKKTDAVQNFPRPKNTKEVRMFLGLCNYYRRFIKNMAKEATPLYRLTSKDAKF